MLELKLIGQRSEIGVVCRILPLIRAVRFSCLRFLDLSCFVDVPLPAGAQNILRILPSKWFDTILLLLSVLEIPQCGVRSKFRVISKDLIRMIANTLPINDDC